MSTSQTVTAEFEQLLDYIRDERGFDFTGYKRPSLVRRISKRMQEVGIASYGDYETYLASHSGEFNELFNTILINVTAFFRDEVAWDYLRCEIVPRIVEHHADDGSQIRIWSTGCATGEEAFSLAMVFAEAMGEGEFRARVKIYATDIDDDALNLGRHAEYGPKEMEPVSEELREKYFERTDGNWTFRADLRRAVIFGRHDLIQDPPISKIDLLLSRNTLMYFDADTQADILTSFHFALRDDGYLFLGKSEALAARTGFFAPVDLRRRIFAKVSSVDRPRLKQTPVVAEKRDTLAKPTSDSVIRDASFDAAPVAQIAIDAEGNLILANLQARAYFGVTHHDLAKPFKDLDLSFRPVELRSRIEQLYRERHAISLRDVEWRVGGDARYLDVQLTPLMSSRGEVIGVGITFTEVTRYRRLQEALQESKRDIETAYEELQSTVEELETANEELQSTNEELETTNEELQATNEELETMNEELQSTNEELETMNDELNERTFDLNEANAFLGTVLGGLRAGVVVVDTDLVIEAWNDGARQLWGLQEDETVGKHFLNLDIGLAVDQLHQPIKDALAGDGEVGDLTIPAVNRRGRKIECHVSLTPMTNHGGEASGVILLMQSSGASS